MCPNGNLTGIPEYTWERPIKADKYGKLANWNIRKSDKANSYALARMICFVSNKLQNNIIKFVTLNDVRYTKSDVIRKETGNWFYWSKKTSNRLKCIWWLFCSQIWFSTKYIWSSQTSQWRICFEEVSNRWMNVFLSGKKICHCISKDAFIYNVYGKAFNENSNLKKHMFTYTREKQFKFGKYNNAFTRKLIWRIFCSLEL